VEGIHDRGWVFVSEGVRKNRQYIHGRLFRLMADTLEALFRLISPIHEHSSYSSRRGYGAGATISKGRSRAFEKHKNLLYEIIVGGSNLMGHDILNEFTQLRSIGGNGLRYIGYVSASFAIRP